MTGGKGFLKGRVPSLWRTAGRPVLDLLLPPRCLACGALAATPGRLCGACWRGLDFLTGPGCACCGYPFEAARAPADTLLCGVCAGRPRHFDRVRSALRYDGASRALLLAFKHGDRAEYAPYFAALLRSAGRELLADCDLILPVPLHRRRLIRRRYNQAALLAGLLAGRTGIPDDPFLLRRHRHTPPQQGDHKARRRNVRGAFVPDPERVRRAAGKRLLLIDDVYTTGATLEACAAVLKKAGARRVDGLTIARVVRPTR